MTHPFRYIISEHKTGSTVGTDDEETVAWHMAEESYIYDTKTGLQWDPVTDDWQPVRAAYPC